MIEHVATFMTPIRVIFYLFSLLAVGSAFTVITVRNPVRSVLALVVTFFAMSGVWMILHAEFLSLVLLLVYVGAVMTLFLFVVMMLNIDVEDKGKHFVRYLPFGIVIVIITLGLILLSVGPSYFGLTEVPVPSQPENAPSNLVVLGRLLFTDYAYPFEIAGVLLLAAIIAAITLTHREPRRRKIQKINEQINVRPEDRLRLITMPSEPKEGKNDAILK